jgi:hypothetical protein
LDPENRLVSMETHLPTPMTARVELLIYQRVTEFNNRKENHGKTGEIGDLIWYHPI